MDERTVETKVLACIYNQPEVVTQLRARSTGLKLIYFLYPQTQIVAKATLEYFNKYEDIPPNRESLVKQIRVVRPALTENDFPHIDRLLDLIYENDDPAHFEFVRDQLIENWQKKTSIVGLGEAVKALEAGKTDKFIEKLLEIPQLITGESDKIIRLDPVTKDADRLLWNLDQLRQLPVEERDMDSIKTPIGWLNDNLDGGFLKGEHYLLFAFPGRGKSMTAADFSHFFAICGWKVVVFELEMSALKMSHRIHSRRSGIPHRVFRRPWMMTEDQFNRHKRLKNEWKEKGYILEIRSFKGRPTVKGIEVELMGLGFNPDVVIIDQLPDIAPTLEWLNMAMIARDIEDLAKSWNKEQGLVMLTFGQAKTDTEWKPYLSMQDFAFGRQPCDYASAVMYYAQTKEDEERHLLRLGICKNRDGEFTRDQEILYPRREICRVHCPERAANEAPSTDDDDSMPPL